MPTNAIRIAMMFVAPLSIGACDQSADNTSPAPTQSQQIDEFCNQIASDFVASGGQASGQFMGRMQQKILEEEWSPDTVMNACSEAVRRKTEFVSQHAQSTPEGKQ